MIGDLGKAIALKDEGIWDIGSWIFISTSSPGKRPGADEREGGDRNEGQACWRGCALAQDPQAALSTRRKAGLPPLAMGWRPAQYSAEQIARAETNGFCQPLHRRYLGVALAALDAADLGGVDAAAFGNFLLRHFAVEPRSPQVPPKVATHARDRRCWRSISP